MRYRLTVLVVATSLMGAAALAATPQGAADFGRTIHEKGAIYAFSKMTRPQFDHALAEAAKGQPEWLQVVADLLPGTDGANSEAIEGAVSAALQAAPAYVLHLIQATPARLEIGRICEDRTIEPKATEARVFELRSTKALQKVTEPSLRTLRNACLISLKKTSASSEMARAAGWSAITR